MPGGSKTFGRVVGAQERFYERRGALYRCPSPFNRDENSLSARVNNSLCLSEGWR